MNLVHDTQVGPDNKGGHWLNTERLRAYPWIFIGLYVLAAIAWWLTAVDGVDHRGKPLGYDFITFWSASYLALSGTPVAAFDPAAIFHIEQLAVPAGEKLFLWHHPPTFMALIYPIALLPYIPAYFVWMALTLALFVWMMARLAPSPYTVPLTLAFGGTFINFFHGQTGFLMTALLGAALMSLDNKRPVIAGVFIALMTIKPHLGFLIPLVLIAGGYWRAFGAAVVATLGFWALSTLLLGTDLWIAGVENLAKTRYVMDTGLLPWAKMPSLYATFMMLGSSTSAAYGAQTILAVVVAITVIYAWRGAASFAIKSSVLVCGAILIPPYIFDYDLTFLAIPIALLAREGVRTGWRAYEREILVIAGLAPMVGPIVAEPTGIPVTLFMVLPLFGIALGRAFLTSQRKSTDGAEPLPAINVAARADRVDVN